MMKMLLSAVVAVALIVSSQAYADTANAQNKETNHGTTSAQTAQSASTATPCQMPAQHPAKTETDDNAPYSGCWPYGHRCK